MRRPEDRHQRASRLRIGGWLTNHDAPAPSAAPRPAGLSASGEVAGEAEAEPAEAPAGHRRPGAPRWLAAAAIITVLFSAGVIVSLNASRGADPIAVAPPSTTAAFPAYPSTAPASWSRPATTSAPSRTPTRTAPPARTGTAAPAPVTPSVTVTTTAVPDTVDLAGEGTRDWVHWGLTGAGALDRKRGGTGAIRDLGGSRGRYDNNPQRFTWTGGTPTASSSGTPTGVYACGQGSGFTLRVAAGPGTRTLRFYAGVWKARGQLTVKIGSDTATAALENRQAITTARFVIRFRAPAGSTLSITWTTAATFDPTCGNVDMQAATLA